MDGGAVTRTGDAEAHRSAPCSGGCTCVPGLTPPDERVAALRAVLESEPEPLVSLTHLLRLCRDEHATLWEHHADPRCRARVEALVARVAHALPAPGAESQLAPAARRAVADSLTAAAGVPPVVIAHALAELLDVRFGHVFTDWFRQRSPYQPTVGDPIPLDSPDLRRITTLPPTAPPWRLANRLDETRRVRLAGAWTTQFRVVFDYSVFDTLAGVIGEDAVIATGHPNRNLGELSLPGDRRQPAFPVGPVDVAGQRARIDELLAIAAAEGASVVVLPELSVTEELAADLAGWVRRPGPLRLLVAGSYHHTDGDGGARRSNRALAWVRGHRDALVHDKHSPADQPVAEDITPTGWPELRVYVTADGWHLVIAVCRDLLNPQAVHALTEAGANLVLAPAMSETLVAFGGPVAQLVGTTQAVVAVANNPADWSDPDRPDDRRHPARSVFGHPGFAHQTRQVTAPDGGPGVSVLRVGPGRLTWRPANHDRAEDEPDTRPAGGDPSPPPWALDLCEPAAAAASPVDGTVALRAAAVLVLLTDGPDGPEVLLTGRAPDLTHYGSQFVFPGGLADADDRGPLDTALREAREEIGLDPATVHVVGTLPSFALPDSRFLVTPVVAWSERPGFLHPPNPAEVAAVHAVPILAGTTRSRRPTVGATGDGDVDGVVGTMTQAVLDVLAARLGRQPAGPDRGDGPESAADRPPDYVILS